MYVPRSVVGMQTDPLTPGIGCIAIGPAFFSAAIYFTISKMYVLGSSFFF